MTLRELPPLGITTLAASETGTLIGSKWTEDVRNLRGQGSDLGIVRCGIVENPDTGQIAYSGYKEGFALYSNEGLHPIAICPPEFYYARTERPRDRARARLRDFTNEYIEGFAGRVVEVAIALSESGLTDFIIWNEPNAENTVLPPKHFAALMYQTRVKINEAIESGDLSGEINLIWGGIIFGRGENGTVDEVDQNALSYIRRVYKVSPDRQFPWDGVNIHIHRLRDEDHIQYLVRRVRRIMSTNNDSSLLIVGEEGVLDVDGGEELVELDNRIANALVDSRMLFVHHVVEDEHGVWGLRQATLRHDPTHGEVVITPVPDEEEGKTVLYDAAREHIHAQG